MPTVNPILAETKLEYPREIKCPGCSQAIKERLNVYYHGEVLNTPTEFVCEQCHTWICGCCGERYQGKTHQDTVRQSPIQLPQPREWKEEVDRLREVVKALHRRNDS